MPRRSKTNQNSAPADYWNGYFESDGAGSSGFTEGILKLNQVFRGGNTLESLGLGYIDPEDQFVYSSMFMRGLRQLQHPEMQEKFSQLMNGGADGEQRFNAKEKEINPIHLPFYMQVTLSLIAASNSVNGRGQQRRVDMHTQYNSISAIPRLTPLVPSVMDAAARNNNEPRENQEN